MHADLTVWYISHQTISGLKVAKYWFQCGIYSRCGSNVSNAAEFCLWAGVCCLIEFVKHTWKPHHSCQPKCSKHLWKDRLRKSVNHPRCTDEETDKQSIRLKMLLVPEQEQNKRSSKLICNLEDGLRLIIPKGECESDVFTHERARV